MYEEISRLIEQKKYQEALTHISEAMEKDGFSDTLAILAASVNLDLGEYSGAFSMVESGIAYNPANYELHFMKANLLYGEDIPQALDEYETALAYCSYAKGKGEDYSCIESAYRKFVQENLLEIENYIKSLPILVYKSDDICFGILNRFAEIIAKELSKSGETIEIIDMQEIDPAELPTLLRQRYKAILGIQTYVFSIEYKDGRNVHDFVFGPKYNMVFDHPACMYNHFTKGPSEYIILTHDRNYEAFIKKYYLKIEDSVTIPTGGIIGNNREYSKEYGIVFVGSYKAPDTWDGVIAELDKVYCGKAKALVNEMMEHPNSTYEDSLREIFGDNSELRIFFDLKQTYFKVMSEYRERILATLLDAGIEINVFGDSWRASTFRKYKNLIIHPELSFDDSITVYEKARISLNIMSWHKDGRTERVANSMLNSALVVSDKSEYLSDAYSDGEDIILFDLEDIQSLPVRLKLILGNPSQIEEMARKARIKAEKTDTWEKVTDRFLDLVNRRNHEKYCSL